MVRRRHVCVFFMAQWDQCARATYWSCSQRRMKAVPVKFMEGTNTFVEPRVPSTQLAKRVQVAQPGGSSRHHWWEEGASHVEHGTWRNRHTMRTCGACEPDKLDNQRVREEQPAPRSSCVRVKRRKSIFHHSRRTLWLHWQRWTNQSRTSCMTVHPERVPRGRHPKKTRLRVS